MNIDKSFIDNNNWIMRRNYIIRHSKREENRWNHTFDNLMTTSYLSRYILWEKETI